MGGSPAAPVSAEGNLMTRKLKIVLVFTHLAFLAIGFVAGLYSSFAKYAQESMNMSSQMAMISHYSMMVDAQRNEGDRDAYRKSLITYLNVMDDIFKHPTKIFDVKTTSVDKMLILERLSRLEREAGNAKAADDYMKSAIQSCGNAGWKDCSIEKISDISRKLEEKSLIPPKSPNLK
jgi:hypothetical protein